MWKLFSKQKQIDPFVVPDVNVFPGNKSNGAMRTGSVGSNSRTTTPPMEGKQSRFAVLGRLFKPWKWKRKKKSDKFEQTSRTLERKISMRSTKEELIKKGVLLPDGSDKDQQGSPKQKDSSNHNHIPQANGCVSTGDEVPEANKVASSTSSGVFYNSIVVTSSPNVSTVLTASSQANGLSSPVIHSVSLLNLPDIEEVPLPDGEITLSVLPDPPISVNDIGPIPPPPMFSNPSPFMGTRIFSQSGYRNEEVEDDAIRDPSSCIMYIPQRDPTINTSTVEEIPAKEPHLTAMPKKSALKKKGGITILSPVTSNSPTSMNSPKLSSDSRTKCPSFSCALKSRFQNNRTGNSNSSQTADNKENRPLPQIAANQAEVSDSDSESDNPILWRDYYGDDEQCREVAKVARKDSLAMKLAQRPDLQELIDKNIYIAQTEKERQETREDVGKKLIRRLSLRPTPEELEQRNILKYQTAEELRKEKEQKKKTLIRKLSFRPTIEELKERKIIRFNDYVEVTQAQDYDRRADKPWTRLTPRDKAAIRKELNEFKSMEMEVHEDSRHLTRFHRP